MSDQLTKEQIEDLLSNVLQCDKIGRWKGDKISCCCPIHGENNPSFAILAGFKPEGSDRIIQSYNCLACGAHGSIPRLLMAAMPDRFHSFYDAFQFLAHRYGVYYNEKLNKDGLNIVVHRYLDSLTLDNHRQVLSNSMLAGFKSGKETYNYFFNRGFTKEDMKEYMIGRDLEKKTVTIPVFWQDGKLAGVIGRYVKARPKVYRYEIYGFEKSKLLYPIDKLEVKDRTIILVEGQFDAIMLRKWGYKNVLATMGGTISSTQFEFLEGNCDRVVPLFDFDSGGEKALEKLKGLAKRSSLHIVNLDRSIDVEGKDPSEWGESVTRRIIENAGAVRVRRI